MNALMSAAIFRNRKPPAADLRVGAAAGRERDSETSGATPQTLGYEIGERKTLLFL